MVFEPNLNLFIQIFLHLTQSHIGFDFTCNCLVQLMQTDELSHFLKVINQVKYYKLIVIIILNFTLINIGYETNFFGDVILHKHDN